MPAARRRFRRRLKTAEAVGSGARSSAKAQEDDASSSFGPVRETARHLKPGRSVCVVDMRAASHDAALPLNGVLLSSRSRKAPRPSAIAVGAPRCPVRPQSPLVWAIARFSRNPMPFRPVPKRSSRCTQLAPCRRTLLIRPVLKQLAGMRSPSLRRRTMPFRPVLKPMPSVSAHGPAFCLRTSRKKIGFALQRPRASLRLIGLHARRFPRPPRYWIVF